MRTPLFAFRGLVAPSLGLALALLAAPVAAQEGSQDIAKKLSNPISDMASIPLQFNWENGVGSDEGLRTVLNFQPVVPIPLSAKLNLIGRWILPSIAQPASLGGGSGFGDVTFSAFLSPAGAGSFTWGIGPVFLLPMTSDPTLGSGQWAAGPTAVALRTGGAVLYGVLVNQLWSFGATSDVAREDVNQSFVQPFLALCTKGGVTYTLQSESVANWNAPEGTETWTVPVNVQVSKVTRLGSLPFSVTGGGGVYVAGPESGPEWKLRTAFTVILPRKSR